uniref:Uncharacterized protein n=1 Tax=Lotus japonicus TaxID=34305 RepID=I3S022_LOTJA|nr:unknown [Lotus japonicus]
MATQDRSSLLILRSKILAVSTPRCVEFDNDEIVLADNFRKIGVIQCEHELLSLRFNRMDLRRSEEDRESEREEEANRNPRHRCCCCSTETVVDRAS